MGLYADLGAYVRRVLKTDGLIFRGTCIRMGLYTDLGAAYIRRGLYTKELIFRGTYIRRGLFSEFHGRRESVKRIAVEEAAMTYNDKQLENR